MTTLESPDPVTAPSWSIRPELAVDLDQIHELHRAAFRGPAEAELVDAVRAGAGFIPELSLVAAADDGSVLGHILVSVVGFQPDEEDAPRRDTLALAPVAVLPPYWGRGIGTALMTHALAVADGREEPFVTVVGSPAFYGRFGFRPAADAGITSVHDSAGDAFQVRPTGSRPLPAGTVIYPPAFAEV